MITLIIFKDTSNVFRARWGALARSVRAEMHSGNCFAAAHPTHPIVLRKVTAIDQTYHSKWGCCNAWMQQFLCVACQADLGKADLGNADLGEPDMGNAVSPKFTAARTQDPSSDNGAPLLVLPRCVVVTPSIVLNQTTHCCNAT